MTDSSSVRYLPGLDGLRGIGIILMMLYHANVAWVGDGALFTIEMFFVLSGYLITSLFLVEHRGTGRIDLRRFWVRRGRRLLPAILMTFVPIAIYSATTATSAEVPRMRSDGLAVLLYGSNWSFIFSGKSYFEQFSLPSPFSHTWSLAIEEQFYLLIAVVVAVGFRRWKPDRLRWGVLAGAGVLLSAAWMAALTRFGDLTAEGLWPLGIDPESLSEPVRVLLNMSGNGDPSRAYYGTDTRLQGLLTGVALAFFLARYDVGKLSRRTVEMAAWVGVGGIVAVFLGLATRGITWIYYGGFLAFDLLMVPVVVALTAPDPPRVVRWLSWPPLVFVGVLSYSLYVWHLPVFVFLDETHLQIPVRGVWIVILKVAVSAVVAYLSFRFVERPIRRHGLPSVRWRLTAAGAVLASLVVFAGLTAVAAPSGDDPLAMEAGTEALVVGDVASGGGPVVMINGDSQAYGFAAGVRAAAADTEAGVQVRSSATLGCGLIAADYVLMGTPFRQNPICKTWPERWETRVGQWQPALTLVMAWGWDVYDRRVPGPDGELQPVDVGSPEWAELETAAMQLAIDVVLAGGGKIALVTFPCVDLDADTPLRARTEPDIARRVGILNGVMRDVVAANASPSVSLIDLAGFLCPDGENYRVEIDGVVMTNDSVHFSAEGALVVWRWMEPQIQSLLEAP